MFRPPADSGPDSKVIFPEQWHGRPPTPDPSASETGAVQALPERDEETAPSIDHDHADSQLPALPATPPRPPLVPERSDFLEGDAPAADKVQAFLANALAASGSPSVAAALVPWICDALLSNHSVKAYGRDFMDFVRRMQAQGVTPLEVTADHVKMYKRSLLEAGMTPATVARRLSVLRGATSSSPPRGSSRGRSPRTSPPSKPPACRKTPRPH